MRMLALQDSYVIPYQYYSIPGLLMFNPALVVLRTSKSMIIFYGTNTGEGHILLVVCVTLTLWPLRDHHLIRF